MLLENTANGVKTVNAEISRPTGVALIVARDCRPWEVNYRLYSFSMVPSSFRPRVWAGFKV